MLPIGAYAPRWFMHTMHMDPEEAVQAAQDLGARIMVPMHWGTFPTLPRTSPRTDRTHPRRLDPGRAGSREPLGPGSGGGPPAPTAWQRYPLTSTRAEGWPYTLESCDAFLERPSAQRSSSSAVPSTTTTAVQNPPAASVG